MATDRVSLIHFEKLSLSPAAADRFQKALDALAALKLQDRYVYLIAPYLGDIADASDAEQLDTALGQCIRVIDELLAADVLVFGVPIYNFSVPASFKAYLDQVIRMGRTARFTSSGPEGLVKGKQAYIITASGSDFTQEPFRSLDHHTPYIKTVLNFIGITDVTFIRQHGYTPEAQEQNLAAARKDIETLTREGQLTRA